MMNNVIIPILSPHPKARTRAGENSQEPYLDSSSAIAAHPRDNGIPYRSLRRSHRCHPPRSRGVHL